MNGNNFFLFFDGLPETVYPSSLELSKTPNIDKLTSDSLFGFYHSVVTPSYKFPKTDSIIPFFFGIEPQEYIGRAALELIEFCIDLKPLTWVISFRVVHGNQDADARSIDVKDHVVDWINSISQSITEELNIGSVISPFSSHKNIIIIWSNNYQKLRDAIIWFSEEAMTRELSIVEIKEHQVKFPESGNSSVKVWGWPKGSLNGAFKIINAQIRYNDVERFDYQAYEHDIKAIIADLISNKEKTKNHVFYVKETDMASHLGETSRKIKAIEFFDTFIGKLTKILGDNDKIIITSDHITDIGATHGEHGLIPFIIYHPLMNKRPLFRFCERNLLNNADTLNLTANELRSLVF